MCFEKISREKTPTSNLATMHTENSNQWNLHALQKGISSVQFSVVLRAQKPKVYKGREPRTSISTFTQFLSSGDIIVNMVLNVHRNHKAY